MTIVLQSRYMALTVTPVASQESDESEIKLILPCDKAGRRLEDVDWSVLGAATAATATELVTAPGPGPVGQLRKRRAMARWGDGQNDCGISSNLGIIWENPGRRDRDGDEFLICLLTVKHGEITVFGWEFLVKMVTGRIRDIPGSSSHMAMENPPCLLMIFRIKDLHLRSN